MIGRTQHYLQNGLHSAETAEQRLALLVEVSTLLAASVDNQVRLQRLVDLLVSSAADWCAIHDIDANGAVRRLAVAHSASIRGDRTQDLRVHALLDPGGDQHPIATVLRTGKSKLISEISDALLIAAARDDEQLAFLRTVNPQSAIIAPLIAGERPFGTLTLLSVDTGRRYGPDDLVLHEEVARRTAQTIENSRLSNQVRKQVVRLHALAEASAAFAEQCLDFHAVLSTIAYHIVKALGDLCLIRLLSEGGQWLQPVAVYHPIPEIRGLLRHMLACMPRRSDEGLVGEVVQSGRAVLLPEVNAEKLDVPTTTEINALREHLEVHSIFIVPLRERGRVIGTVVGWRERPDCPYNPDDLAFARDLADRAALAIENMRLIQELVKRECQLRELMDERRHLSSALPAARPPNRLTPRELEVLSQLVQGRTNREIADCLHVSLSTVKAHIEHIIAKLAVSDRTRAAVRAVELGLISSET
jgi:GAF domain-containing protein